MVVQYKSVGEKEVNLRRHCASIFIQASGLLHPQRIKRIGDYSLQIS